MVASDYTVGNSPIVASLKRTVLTVLLSGITLAAAVLAALVGMLASPMFADAQEVREESRTTRVQALVVEDRTGDPIPTVQVTADGRTILTDAQGRFSIPVTSPDSRIEFQRLGYAPLVVRASSLESPVRLQLRPVLLESFVVSASQRRVLAEGTALSAENVSRADVMRGGGTSRSEAIDQAEGVSVSYMGSWGSRAMLRGLSGERLAVMVDGMRVNRACTYGMDQGLSTVDPALVERVEILSGPGSTLYG